MNTDEWAARTFYYLFHQLEFLPEGTGKNQLAKLLLDAPQSVKDDMAELLIEKEIKDAQKG